MTLHEVFGDELYNLRKKRVETADYKGERLYHANVLQAGNISLLIIIFNYNRIIIGFSGLSNKEGKNS